MNEIITMHQGPPVPRTQPGDAQGLKNANEASATPKKTTGMYKLILNGKRLDSFPMKEKAMETAFRMIRDLQINSFDLIRTMRFTVEDEECIEIWVALVIPIKCHEESITKTP